MRLDSRSDGKTDADVRLDLGKRHLGHDRGTNVNGPDSVVRIIGARLERENDPAPLLPHGQRY